MPRRIVKRKKGKARRWTRGTNTVAIHNANMTYRQAMGLSINRVARILCKSNYNYVRLDATEYNLSSSTVTDQGLALTFKLNNLTDYAEFTALYDSYQICKVEVEARPISIQQVHAYSTIGNTPNTMEIPFIYIYRDLDDAQTPNLAMATSRQDTKRYLATSGFKMSIVPQVSRQIFQSATATAYETPYKILWLDCAQPSIPHYGIKILMEKTNNSNTDPIYKYAFRVKYWVRFRKVI